VRNGHQEFVFQRARFFGFPPRLLLERERVGEPVVQLPEPRRIRLLLVAQRLMKARLAARASAVATVWARHDHRSTPRSTVMVSNAPSVRTAMTGFRTERRAIGISRGTRAADCS
jgi:hypothetical protein